MTNSNDRADRAERAEALVPWATANWPHYCRALRENLVDAARMEARGDARAAEHWLGKAEAIAAHLGLTLDSGPIRTAWTERRQFRDVFVWPQPQTQGEPE